MFASNKVSETCSADAPQGLNSVPEDMHKLEGRLQQAENDISQLQDDLAAARAALEGASQASQQQSPSLPTREAPEPGQEGLGGSPKGYDPRTMPSASGALLLVCA